MADQIDSDIERLARILDQLGMNQEQSRMLLYELAKRGIGLREETPDFSPSPEFLAEPDAPQLVLPRGPGQSLEDLANEIVRLWRSNPPGESLIPIAPTPTGRLLEIEPPGPRRPFALRQM